ncbi:MAG: helix-turn-helix domain-containing protein [Acidobacteriaceae bacterium]
MCAQKSRSVVNRFPAVLREARSEKGLSQEAIADRAGLHRTYISQIERGLKSPSLKSLEQIANALGIPLSNLLKRLET